MYIRFNEISARYIEVDEVRMGKKQKSLKLNMALNAVKGIMGILFPLITFPYISRILGVDNMGKYSFSASVINYFMLFAGLGIGTYAIREGARLRDRPEELQKLASELFSFNMVSTVASYVLLIVFMIVVPKFHQYTVLLAILSLQILFKTVGIEWIYSIEEDYAYITIRSILFYIISLVLMFLLVRSENDVNLYAVVTVISAVGSNVFNFVHARRYCRIRFVRHIDWKKHFHPVMVLFAMSATVSIYVSSDVTVLGLLCDDTAVGIYTVSTRVYNLVKTVLGSVIVVSIPRLSMLLGKKGMGEFKAVARDIYSTLLTLVIPSMLGIILLRKQIILLIAGEQYLEASASLALLAVALLCCFGAYFWGQCILVPMRNENYLFKVTLFCAVVNIILNFFLIPIWEGNAAAVTTIIAEGGAFLLSWYGARKQIQLQGTWKLMVKVLIGCLLIVIISWGLSYICRGMVVYTLLTIALSTIGYFCVELLLKNEVVYGAAQGLLRRIAPKRGKH